MPQMERLKELNLSDKVKQDEYLALPDIWKGSGVPVGFKKCGHCKNVKKAYLFNKDKSNATGLTGNCKECQKKIAKASYEKRKKKLNSKENYEKNKDQRRERSRKYYAENKDKIQERQKAYRSSEKGKKVDRAAKKRRRELINNNKGIPYTRNLVIDRDKLGGEYPICMLCGKPIENLGNMQLDHMIPLLIGGSDCFTNVACTHKLCNLRKTKDAREIENSKVDELIQRSEKYMKKYPDKFK